MARARRRCGMWLALRDEPRAVGLTRAVGSERPPAGLCDTCRHQSIISTSRGPQYTLCERSRTDSSYPRYPRVPVTRCEGHEPRDDGASGGGDAGGSDPAASEAKPSSTETTGS